MNVKVGGDDIFLDPKNLEVSETSLNEFLCRFAGIYSYYSQKWSLSQYVHYCAEDEYERLFAEKYQFYKNDGGSDKLAEAKARTHPEVVRYGEHVRQCKYVMQQLYGYLRSLDKAHENSLNLGYNLRREMDKVFPSSVKSQSFDRELEKLMAEGS